jgi:hypothetical protein
VTARILTLDPGTRERERERDAKLLLPIGVNAFLEALEVDRLAGAISNVEAQRRGAWARQYLQSIGLAATPRTASDRRKENKW